MFPAGAAGVGLLLLRLCASGMLVRNSFAKAAIPTAPWEIVAVGILAGAFCVGAFTPVTCSLSALVQVFILIGPSEPDPYRLVFSLSVTVALFLLGPGAFSLDSRLFGRRLIVPSDSD